MSLVLGVVLLLVWAWDCDIHSDFVYDLILFVQVLCFVFTCWFVWGLCVLLNYWCL